MSKLIAIDNGHGLNTAGKRCPDDSMREWQFNHTTAKYLKEELEYNGFKVLMVSDTQADTPLATRVETINKAKADMSISIHANAFQGSYWGDANGIETFAYSSTSKGNTIAKLVQAELIKATGLRDRGVKYNSLYMTRKPNCPAILCECGFMDNLKEANLLKSDDYRRKCAKAMCKGICKYYGATYKEKKNNDVKIEPPKTDKEFKQYLARCTTDNLNCRKGAGANFEVERQINKGTVITIVGEKMNGNTKWLLAKSNYYVSASYMEFIRYI